MHDEDIETPPALLALDRPASPNKRPVMRTTGIFYDASLSNLLKKLLSGW